MCAWERFGGGGGGSYQHPGISPAYVCVGLGGGKGSNYVSNKLVYLEVNSVVFKGVY